MKKNIVLIVSILSILFIHTSLLLASPTQNRIDKDLASGENIVIHVLVALADNKNQWIVPVPDSLGNGQVAKSNLYWGALYGVKTHMKKSGWKKVRSDKVPDHRILERLILKRKFARKGKTVSLYLVAEAWDGKYIMDTIKQFLRYSGGFDSFNLNAKGLTLRVGGMAHLMVYIGHNALMDYGGAKDLFLSNQKPSKNKPYNDAVVLSCKSNPYFCPRLKKSGTHPLLLTTGLMAPEAYTLQAAISKWIAGKDDNTIRKAAAKSYNKYQKSGLRAAERLFGVKK